MQNAWSIYLGRYGVEYGVNRRGKPRYMYGSLRLILEHHPSTINHQLSLHQLGSPSSRSHTSTYLAIQVVVATTLHLSLSIQWTNPTPPRPKSPPRQTTSRRQATSLKRMSQSFFPCTQFPFLPLDHLTRSILLHDISLPRLISI